MNITELVQELTINGWELWLNDEKLRYRAPKDASVETVLSQLKEHKTEIIQLLQDDPDVVNVYPLSQGQEALLHLWRLSPENTAYNIPFAYKITSEVKVETVKAVYQKLIERHGVLRTTFQQQGKVPLQRVAKFQEPDFEQVDASSWSQTKLDEQLLYERQRPFDLENGPVMRVRMFTRGPREHVLLLCLHHIVTDGVSLAILAQEMLTLYPALASGRPNELPPLEYSYGDYVRWQKELIAGPEGEKLVNYWKQKLDGQLATLDLPTDRPRPPVQTNESTSYKFALSQKLSEELALLAKNRKGTQFVVLLAAFQTLLYRYTRQDDILVGSPTAGRTRPEFAQLTGYFVDPVVMRTDFSQNPSMNELISQVQQTVVEALNHQDLPFPELVKAINPQRDPSRSPIFQTSFTFHRFQQFQDSQALLTGDVIERQGFKIQALKSNHQQGVFDLTLELREGADSLEGIFKYNAVLFDEASIARMSGNFQSLLESIVLDPAQLVTELNMTTEAERQRLLVDYNNTAVEYPHQKTIHQMFEEQVLRAPDAVAVVFEGEQLTYSQLNERSNQIAHFLLERGVTPDNLVALCIERSLDMLAGLLGILKAGGAYVPIDPNFPAERIDYILDDIKTKLILTQSAFQETLASPERELICLDAPDSVIKTRPVSNPESGVAANNLAYVIYTSGSTGGPKGVTIEHSGVVNLALYLNGELNGIGLKEGKRWAWNASFTFDSSLKAISQLLFGAALYPLPESLRKDPEALLGFFQANAINIFDSTPAQLEMLIDDLNREITVEKFCLLIGGEAINSRLWKRIVTFCEGEKHHAFNVYGPTECTVDSTLAHIQKTELPHIGKAVANTRLYILDQGLKPVPAGVPGELHIGGVGLAREYLNRPELTREKFIADPFSDSPEERLYKTGDIVRYLPNGSIEYVGRIDDQVKIRGFRIELGEIENQLNLIKSIHESVVLAKENDQGHKALVAYIVSDEAEPDLQAIKTTLRTVLPDYMIPAAICGLDALPLTSNGKVDKKTLLAMDVEIKSSVEYVAPRNELEENLVAIFQELLGVKKVGIYDNFFDLGGHSLLATQAVSRIRKEFMVALSLKKLFENASIEGLATAISAQEQDTNALEIPLADREAPLALSFAQERLWFLNQYDKNNTSYNMPGLLLLEGTLNVEALEQSLRTIITRHEALRTNFTNHDGVSRQVIGDTDWFSAKQTDLSGMSPEETEVALQKQIHTALTTPFDLENAPLVRAELYQVNPKKHYLFVNMHHIISDGWSTGVLIQEFVTLYKAFINGQDNPLPPLELQYADYAVWQRDYLNGETLEKKLLFWREQLEGTQTLELPTTYPRPPQQNFNGGRVNFSVNQEITHALEKLGREGGATMFMVLLAAFSVLLHRYSRQNDIAIGSPIANRNHADIEPLIGFFVNTLVFRQNLSANPSFSELLERVKPDTLEAYEHQDMPFEKIVEALGLERDLSRSPLFQVMFVLQNTPHSDLSLPDLQISSRELENNTTKFDLMLGMEQKNGILEANFRYRRDLFSHEAIQAMSEHFKELLSSIAAAPRTNISNLEMLTAQEKNRLLLSYNETAADFPREQTIHGMFEAQVARTPDAIALVFEEKQLTYQELNERSNQIAHFLMERGVSNDTLIALCVERSLEMIVGLLGILKAGGAYVPIDPNFPAERINYMLDDTQAKFLLTQEAFAQALPLGERELICLDAAEAPFQNQPRNNPARAVTAQNLAYVIYTSGSTGGPKGVTIEHSGVINLALYLNGELENIGLKENKRWAWNASFTFDSSLKALSQLLYGAALYPLPESMRRDPDALQDFFQANNINIFDCTPAQMELLIDTLGETVSVDKFCLLIGGEAINAHLWKRILSFCGQGKHHAFNVYGPTECTVDATLAHIRDTEVPHIGKAIANTSLYILDQELNPVPQGVPGELHIGGAGLAREYLNRPEMTLEKFISSPFSDKTGERIYKTGDLVRYLPDGNIEYVGRMDDQVKIRGFRVELGEIESALTALDSIRESVLLVKENDKGHKALVAYIVTDESQDEAEPDVQAIKTSLRAVLPEYMVPSAICGLEALPLTPNGKVDKKALLALEVVFKSSVEYVAPRDEIEEKMVTIFSDVLNLEQVGIHDNFFEMGGDSILSIQIVSRAKQLGLVCRVKDLFQHPTIAQLSNVITKSDVEILAEQGLVQGEMALNPVQSEFFEHDFEVPNHWNQSLLLRSAKSRTISELEEALGAIVAQHDILRVRFERHEEGVRQIHQELSPISIQQIDLSGQVPGGITEKIEDTCQATQSSLSLYGGPLFKVVHILTPDADTHNRILFVMHHLIVDGVSWRILMEDLNRAVNSIGNGKEIKLGMKSSSYQQYLTSLAKYAQSEKLESELNYWRESVKQDITPLPVETSAGEMPEQGTRRAEATLDKRETQQLLKEVNSTYNTEINDILLSALGLTLGHWTNENEFRITLEGHGREDIDPQLDITRTFGWFTSKFPVLLKVADGSNPEKLIKSTKEQLRAIPERGVGYGILRYMHPAQEIRKSLTQTGPAQVVFNYLGQFDAVTGKSDLFAAASESSGREQAEQNHRTSLISVGAFIAKGTLQIRFTSDTRNYSQETLATLAEGFIESLTGLLKHCLLPDSKGFTPSDFPLASLSQRELDTLVLNKENIHNLESVYPLTPMQEGMLFHSLHEPEGDSYIEQIQCDFHNSIDHQAFEKAWEFLIRRHTVLRSSFVYAGLEKPLQRSHKQVPTPFELLDYSSHEEETSQTLFSELCTSEFKAGFDLAKAPLMRIKLVKVNDELYRFIWTHHHILLDGWSLPIIFKELFMAYTAYTQGANQLPMMPDAYEDFIAYLESRDREATEKFWREYLKGFSTPTSLSAAVITPVREAKRFMQERLSLSPELSGELETFARDRHLTVNTLVQGAWALILGRYSRNSEVIFGATVSGRPAELEDVETKVGIFINTLPVRVPTPFGIQEQESQPIKTLDWLKELQEQQLALREYEHSALTDIKNWSEVSGGTSLFDSIVVFENYPVSDITENEESPIDVQNIQMNSHTNYPLTLGASMSGESGELDLKLAYNNKFYDKKTINQILGQFTVILKQFLTQADEPVFALDILTEAERRQLLVDYNQTEAEYPRAKTIHEMFEAQVERSPDAIGAVFAGAELTYKELNERANQVAHYLIETGVSPDTLVALVVERSLDMLIGLLGILKAGGAYVPINPNFPADRIEYMLNDTRTKVILSQAAFRDTLPFTGREMICLDAPDAAFTKYSTANPETNVSPNNLAYVIYTSGSTGQPKGVSIEHDGVINLGWDLNQELETAGLTQDKRWAWNASYTFDASLQALTQLLHGATLYPLPEELRKDPEALMNFFRDNAINIFDCTPAQMELLVDDLHEKVSVENFTVFIGGEAISPRLWKRIVAFCEQGKQGKHHAFNAYGPTECTVDATLAPITKEETPHIGKAVANTQLYILDQGLKLVPPGVPGELHIGGAGLAREYLNQPELTREKFIPNPFSNTPDGPKTPGERLYKTGDLVRHLPDGNIEYVGRMDDQVKIRGFRIELGEIESALTALNGISESVVLVKEDHEGNKMLLAYIVGDEAEPDSNAIRNKLRNSLPDYMIPTAVTGLESLPLTANGKVDKKILLAQEVALKSSNEYLAPRNEQEEKIAEIFSEVLKVERVGVNDNFFELGGHSLLAVQLTYKINQAFERRMPLSALLLSGTVAAIGEYLERQPENEGNYDILVPLQPKGSQTPVFAVAGTAIMLIHELGPAMDPEQPLYGLQAVGLDGEETPLESVEEMAKVYIKEMKTIQAQGPYRLAGYSFGGSVAYEMGLQLEAAGEQVEYLGLFDSNAPSMPGHQDKDDKEMLVQICRSMAARYKIELDETLLENYNEQEIIAYIKGNSERYALPVEFDGLEPLWKVFKTNTNIRYTPQGKLDCANVQLFKALRPNASEQPNDYGWLGYLKSEPLIHNVSGEHETMLKKEHVQGLADIMGATLKDLKRELVHPG